VFNLRMAVYGTPDIRLIFNQEVGLNG